MSKRNGYNGNPSQFFGGMEGSLGTGCVVYVTPSDLDSDMWHQSNVLSNHSFKVKATIRNHTDALIPANTITLRVVAISDAYIKCDNGKYTEQLASILPSELKDARDMYQDMTFDRNHVLGGSVWSWLGKHVLKPAVRFARNNLSKLHTGFAPVDMAANAVGNAVKDGTAIGNYAKSHGYGKQGNGIINLGGSNVLGGKKLTQAQLLSLLE